MSNDIPEASRAPSWCWWGDGVCSDGLSMSLSYWYVMAIHCSGGIMEMRKGGVGEDSPRIQNLSCLFVCSWLWRIIFPSANFVTLRTWQARQQQSKQRGRWWRLLGKRGLGLKMPQIRYVFKLFFKTILMLQVFTVYILLMPVNETDDKQQTDTTTPSSTNHHTNTSTSGNCGGFSRRNSRNKRREGMMRARDRRVYQYVFFLLLLLNINLL